LFTNYRKRSDEFVSEDELTMKMMCVAAMGRAAADAQFRLGGAGETPLRVRRDGDAKFEEDPIYTDINATLDRFAERLSAKQGNGFINPFTGDVAGVVGAKSMGLAHPLGACPVPKTSAGGVCDAVELA